MADRFNCRATTLTATACYCNPVWTETARKVPKECLDPVRSTSGSLLLPSVTDFMRFFSRKSKEKTLEFTGRSVESDTSRCCLRTVIPTYSKPSCPFLDLQWMPCSLNEWICLPSVGFSRKKTSEKSEKMKISASNSTGWSIDWLIDWLIDCSSPKWLNKWLKKNSQKHHPLTFWPFPYFLFFHHFFP